MKFLIAADRAGDLQDLIKHLCHMVGSDERQTSRDEESLTIHDMIRVPAATIRYGDKVGPISRSAAENNYRIFTPDHEYDQRTANPRHSRTELPLTC
jgi:hypothetical protein